MVGLDAVRAAQGPGSQGQKELVTRSRAPGKQPFAEGALIALTALPDQWDTVAFNF